jgi:hypothetical protein
MSERRAQPPRQPESVDRDQSTLTLDPTRTAAEADAAIDAALTTRWPGLLGVNVGDDGITTLTYRTDEGAGEPFPDGDDPERRARFARDLELARSFRRTWAKAREGARYLKGR